MKKISTKISLYVGLIVLVVCAGLGVIAYYNGSSAVLNEVENALIMQAQEASRYIDSYFDVHIKMLETMAQRPEIQSMDWEQQYPVLRGEAERLTQYLALGIVDRQGHGIYSDNTTAELGDRVHIIKALAGESNVSDLMVSRVNNSLVIMYVVPIKKDGQVVGALVARTDGLELSAITDRLGFGDTGYAFITNASGTMYAHSDRQYVLDQYNLFDSSGPLADVGRAIKELGIGKTGMVRYILNNYTRLCGVAPISSTGWMIGIAVLEHEVLDGINRLQVVILLVSAIFIILGVGAAIFMASKITNPLRQVQNVIEAVAAGDLTKAARVKSKDEVGRVATALNATIESIRDAMRLVTETSNELAGTSEEMAATSQEISASIEEVASTTNEFSSALDMMNSNAQTMTVNVQRISNKSTQGAGAIGEIINEVNALQNNTSRLATDISELGGLSDEIGQIVNVIDEIAEQTNLLALNAAIEAARAGEHGRGFAVVADEVRRLAEQSSKATTEITNLIGQIQGGIAVAVTGMNDGTSQTARVAKSVDESGEILRDILQDVDNIVGAVQAISASLEETNSGGHEIASATEEQADRKSVV